MIPTFDFNNLIRRAVRLVLATVSSPVVIMLGISAGLASAASVYLVWYKQLSLPDIEIMKLDFSQFDTAWVNLAAYCLDFGVFVKIWDFLKYLIPAVLVVVVSFIASCFACLMSYKAICAVRRAIMDME